MCKLISHECQAVQVHAPKITIVKAQADLPLQSKLPDPTDDVLNAAKILKCMATKHKLGDPIPLEIEQQTAGLGWSWNATRETQQCFIPEDG